MSQFHYHFSIDVGSRVQIAPYYDLWMRGAMFGTVTRVYGVGNSVVQVRMDNVKKLQTFPANDLTPIGARSWFVEVESELGRYLLGGVRSTRSSRFAMQEQAERWAEQCVKANGADNIAQVRIVWSKLPYEIGPEV